MSLEAVFNTPALQEFKGRLENQAHLCRAGQELAISILHRGMNSRGQDPYLSAEANQAGLNLALLNDLMSEGVVQWDLSVLACLEVTRRILSPESVPYTNF